MVDTFGPDASPAPGVPRGEELTGLLQAWGRGDEAALGRLTPIVYNELHRLARLRLLGERSNHVLQPSALVNEVFLRLMGSVKVDWINRNQFYAISERLMRQVLAEFACATHVDPAVLRDLSARSPALPREDLLAIDSALDRLESVDPRRARVVELRFYGGLETSDIAAVLGVSEATITRDWRIARASLLTFLKPDAQ